MKKWKKIITPVITVAAIAASLVTVMMLSKKEHDIGRSFYGTRIRCAIDLGSYDDSLKALTSGYNFVLLKHFAKDISAELEIGIRSDSDQNFIDSIRNGSLDILVVPTSFHSDSLLCSEAVDGLSLWVLNGNNILGLRDVNSWIQRYLKSEDYHQLHNLYVRTFNNPFKVAEMGLIRDNISPYDSLFVKYSAELGWDWRALAALAYKESKFRIDAHSKYGATGIMQIMPVTAERYEVENLLDPEENIKAGVAYLKSLQRIFSKRVRKGDVSSLVSFTLAAYNAGEGHIIDCVEYARHHNVYDSTWASVGRILPDMTGHKALECEAVKLGTFKSGVTADYVDDIHDLYEAFLKICP